MPGTYEPIATQTLGSAVSSVTFSSIPSTYTDLVLVANASGTGPSSILLQFNADTTSNYSDTLMTGYLGSALSGRDTSATQIGTSWTGGSMNGLLISAIINLQNYSNTTTNKTVLARFNSPTSEVTAGVGLWRNTAAINTIRVLTSVNTYATGSTFTLYGIKAA
jgi:hypothetical protein